MFPCFVEYTPELLLHQLLSLFTNFPPSSPRCVLCSYILPAVHRRAQRDDNPSDQAPSAEDIGYTPTAFLQLYNNTRTIKTITPNNDVILETHDNSVAERIQHIW